MPTHSRISLAGSLVFLLACRVGDTPPSNAGRPEDPGGTPLGGATVSLTRLRTDSVAFASYSGIRTAATTVIRDQTAWQALWQEIFATMQPVPALPVVDFTQDMIVAAALGTRGSGGYDILFTAASQDTGVVQVQVLETSPGVGCATTQALTQPVDLARMPRHDGPVQFLVTQRVASCDP